MTTSRTTVNETRADELTRVLTPVLTDNTANTANSDNTGRKRRYGDGAVAKRRAQNRAARRRQQAAELPKRDRGLVDTYFRDVGKVELIDRNREFELARRYQSTGDQRAFNELARANLRFVVKIAHEFKGYRVPMGDLIQEGNVGLLVAIRKFDPERGYRLISYAVWWIRAYIQAYVMKSFSLVKIGTTVAQRKLFFKLRAARQEADEAAEEGASGDSGDIARTLGVRKRDVDEMEQRLAARDFSLDAKVGESDAVAFVDLVEDDAPGPEGIVAEAQEREYALATIESVSRSFDERERYILEHRLRAEEPRTLREVGEHLSISRERVRQIQERIVERLRQAVAMAASPALAA